MNAPYDLSECYPTGAPDSFPASYFEPIEGSSLQVREQILRDRIDALQAEMLLQPQAEIPVTNTFAGGVYARQIFIPKGTVAIGRVHLTEHLNICVQGDLTFLTVDGPRRVKAPATFASPPGTKKLAYANEDSIWINVHPAIHDDPEVIVESITVPTYAEYDKLLNAASFERAIAAHGYTPEQVWDISCDDSTYTDIPLLGVERRLSPIHGIGLFSTREFDIGDMIAPAMLGDKRTDAGRYSNHAFNPNCAMVWDNGTYLLMALRPIAAGEELTTDYAATLSLIAQEARP